MDVILMRRFFLDVRDEPESLREVQRETTVKGREKNLP